MGPRLEPSTETRPFAARMEEDRFTSLFGGKGFCGPPKIGTVEPACENEVEPAEKDMEADAGREPVDGVEYPDGDIVDSRFIQDGRHRSGYWGSTVSSSATTSIALSISKFCAIDPPVVLLRSFRLGGRSCVVGGRASETADRVEALEKGEFW